MSGGPAAVALLAAAWMTWDAGRCLRARVTHAITVGRDERARWAAWEANRSRAIRPVGVPVDLTRGT